MAVDRLKGSIDPYVLARLAIWAGCYEFAEQMFHAQMAIEPSYGARQNTLKRSKRRVAYPEGMLGAAAAGYVKAMHRAKARHGRDIIGMPMLHGDRETPTVEAGDLMGAIWRVGATSFEMRAFLRDLNREGQFYENVDRVARQHGWDEGTERESAAADSPKARVGAVRSRDRSWVQRADPYMTVHVGSLTLITALGVWCEVPANGDDIRMLFLRLLKELSGSPKPS